VRKHAIHKPRQASYEVCDHLLRSDDRFAAHPTGDSFLKIVGGMGLFGCTRISPVGRFDVCTYYPDCWAHLERQEGVIKTLTGREYGPLSPAAAAAAAAAPYVAVQKFTYSTIIRNIYLLSKLREREFFLPAAARTVLLLSIAFGRCLHKVVVQRFRYIL